MLLRFPQSIDKCDEDVLQSATVPIARYRQATAAGRRTSFITEHTLLFVLQGHKLLHIGDQTYTAEAGHLLFMKRGIYTLSEFVPGGLDYQVLLLFFTDDLLKKFLHNYGFATTKTVTAATHLVLPSNELLDSFKTQFMEYFGKRIDGLESILQLKQQELLLLLLSGPQRQEVLAFLQGIVFGQPLDVGYIVKTHLFQPLTLEELAKLSGRSLASFKRDFQQQFRCPPKKWINEQRLAHARMLLQHTDKQVAEIALECGFENIPHFIRIFKQEYGITPNADRAKKAIV
ncbi:helix-turn-helix domain-containing protein [Chitinophaga japonensis]|uniref:AraC-type transcriptional regulator n=1 Tax=Chitinophaga japonensis TaxID=104662 RepID=A0A562SHS2_CHIJA|nr:helix-turn-helix domain-containing protein [Chitinophaga japonensis]TWI80859.1 AraC-type transcriptional regulator [Chitinophaga japonensis]